MQRFALLLGLLVATSAAAQFQPVIPGPINPQICPDGYFEYADGLVADPELWRVDWRPTVCNIYESPTFEISPGFPASSGLSFNRQTGRVLSWRVGVNRSDHNGFIDRRWVTPGTTRTVTMRARNRITGANVTVTAPLSYTFSDSNPLRATERNASINWEPFMGDGAHTETTVVGGTGSIRYRTRANTPLPAGFRLDAATGVISGAPANPQVADSDYVAVEAYDTRGRVLTDGLYVRTVDPDIARGDRDLCFIFVHGHRDPEGENPNVHARDYWGEDNEDVRADPDDFTTNVLNRERASDHSFDFIDLVTNNRTDPATRRATGEAIHAGAPRHQYFVVSYTAQQHYWTAANTVADQLKDATAGRPDGLGNVCDPTRVHGYVVIAHSMGGVVMTYIDGNSDGGPFASARFRDAMAEIDTVVTVNSPLQGTHTADLVCGEDVDGIYDGLLRLGIDCDDGYRSLRTDSNVAVRNRITDNRTLRVPIMTQGGHRGLRVNGLGLTSNGQIFGHRPYSRYIVENDGVVDIASQWACDHDSQDGFNDIGRQAMHHFSPCWQGDSIRSNAFYHLGMSSEDHDQARNGSARGVVQNPCTVLDNDGVRFNFGGRTWDTRNCSLGLVTSYFENLGLEDIVMNTPQALRCVLGAGHLDPGNQCPTNFGAQADLTSNLVDFVR